MPARLLDAGARVRSGDHAENDALVVPRAEVAGVDVYLLTPHAGKRRFFRSGKQADSPADKVHVVRAGEALRFELREKRDGGHAVVDRERAAFQEEGFKLHHDRVRLFEFPEKPEIDVFAEERLAVIVGVFLPQQTQMLLDHYAEVLRAPERLVRINDLQHAERDTAEHGVLLKLYHTRTSQRLHTDTLHRLETGAILF